ncbi:MAG: mannose-1-phosphate guanylyltransferase [Sphingomonadales bacterium 32-64-22]|nr:MAG: mannose-1-phosphate guanylyltransferase [Sphingomonadales bacterium 32-64-22]
MDSITPVILCGGSGTRLWPRSRKAAPKPFLPLVGDRSLFEAALGRASDPAHFASPLIVAGAVHLDLIEGQLPQGSGARLVVEPAAKNTAPAIALAAQLLPEDAVMLVCPSDHYIADEAAFVAAALQAARLAREGWLVAFGIAPTRPETGYGYIRQGEELAGGYRIERFVEKPDLERAQAYLAEGTYCWNGGIFAFRAGTYLEELARHRPAMAAAVREAVESADMGWSDIGNWQSLREARASEADAAGNIARGPAELLDCRDVMVDSDGPRVSVVGLDDVIVVIDKGEVLVTSSRGAANVGKLKGASGQ